ncbi:hypothetical protein QUF90_12860 [Desulfococcaceae bacterium HSG9]|nr:hypothetical protein [Desulfococcaceae bacterium HSG9]
MVEKKFKDTFTREWVEQNIPDKTDEPVIHRQIIPWRKIIDRPVSFYNDSYGRMGIPLRTVVTLFIVAKLRLLSDRKVISQVR